MRFKSQSTGEVGKKRQWRWYFSIDVIMKLTVKWQRWRLGFYCFYGFFRSKEIGWYFCVWYCAVLCVAVPHFWCPTKCMQLLFLVSIGPLQGRPFTLMGFFLHQVAFLLRKETFFFRWQITHWWTNGLMDRPLPGLFLYKVWVWWDSTTRMLRERQAKRIYRS